MTVEQCYEQMRADYASALRLMRSDERIIKFMRMMLKDESYARLCHAIDMQDHEAAFQAVHTLKGVTLNLSLNALAQTASKLTEELRENGWSKRVPELFAEVRAEYDIMQAAIQELLETAGGAADGKTK